VSAGMRNSAKYLGFAVAATACAMIVWQHDRNRNLRAENSALHDENETLHGENANLRAAINAKQDSINTLHRIAAIEERRRAVLNQISALAPNSYIVVLGDSITQRAPFPDHVCGLTLVNAGISGSRTSQIISFVEEMDVINAAPAAVVIALGVNDAQSRYRTSAYFRRTYEALIDRLPLRRIVLATLAPIDFSGSDGKNISPMFAKVIDDAVRASASDKGLPLIDLGSLQEYATIDGLHPALNSYTSWIATVLGGIRSILPDKCGPVPMAIGSAGGRYLTVSPGRPVTENRHLEGSAGSNGAADVR
jgi:lysophospholipase L1-like esterase